MMTSRDRELFRLMLRLQHLLQDINSTPGANLTEDKIQGPKLNLLFDFADTTYTILNILVYDLSGYDYGYDSDKDT